MSETDSFIDEVTEEVRRDKLFAMMRKYGWIAVLAMLAIVGGAAWNEWSKARAAAQAQAFGDSLLAASEAADPVAALGAIDQTGARAGVVQMMLGAEKARTGDVAGAVAAFTAAGADASLPRSLRELARLKAVVLAGDTMESAARAAELTALAQAGAPYALLAQEQQALDLLAAGDTDGAIAKARDILAQAGVTPGLQQRASELIVALGGDPAAE